MRCSSARLGPNLEQEHCAAKKFSACTILLELHVNSYFLHSGQPFVSKGLARRLCFVEYTKVILLSFANLVTCAFLLGAVWCILCDVCWYFSFIPKFMFFFCFVFFRSRNAGIWRSHEGAHCWWVSAMPLWLFCSVRLIASHQKISEWFLPSEVKSLPPSL